MKVKINDLVAWEGNPRRERSDEHIGALIASMGAHGQTTPVLVRPHAGGQFEIIAGVTRFMAAVKLDWTELECFDVGAVDDAQALALAVAENTQRRDMTPIEEADGFSKMIAQGLSIQACAAAFGCADVKVKQRLQLAGLTEVARQALTAGKIDMEQAEILSALPEDRQAHWLRECIKGGMEGSWLRRSIFGEHFAVKHAIFDLAAAPAQDLAIIADLFADDDTRVFADKEAAMALQIAAAREKAETAAKSWAFTDVLTSPDDFRTKYQVTNPVAGGIKARKEAGHGLVLIIHPSGQVQEVKDCRKIEDVQADAKKREAREWEKAAKANPAGSAKAPLDGEDTSGPLKAAIRTIQATALIDATLKDPRIAKVAIIMEAFGGVIPIGQLESTAMDLDLPVVVSRVKQQEADRRKDQGTIMAGGDYDVTVARLLRLPPKALDELLARVVARGIGVHHVGGMAATAAIARGFKVSVDHVCGPAAGLMKRLPRETVESEAKLLGIDISQIKTKGAVIEAITKKIGSKPWSPALAKLSQPRVIVKKPTKKQAASAKPKKKAKKAA